MLDDKNMYMSNYANNNDAQFPVINTMNCCWLTQGHVSVISLSLLSSAWVSLQPVPFRVPLLTDTLSLPPWDLYTAHLQSKLVDLIVKGSFPSFLALTPVNTQSPLSIIIWVPLLEHCNKNLNLNCWIRKRTVLWTMT